MTRRRSYHATAPAAGEIVSRRRIPTRAQTVRSDFVVPALTGLYMGVWLGAVFGMVFDMLTGYFWMPFAIFVATFAVVGFLWRAAGIDRMVWASEDVRKMPGEPAPEPMAMPALPEPPQPVLLSPYIGKDAREADRRKEEEDRFAAFVRSCETDTSARYWQAREPRYTEYRNALMGAEWAEWRDRRNPKAGWVLTADAETIIEAMNEGH